MIPASTVEGLTILFVVLAVLGHVFAYGIGRGDARRLRILRRVWRAEVATELQARHEAELELAEKRGHDAAREECGCADADRQIADAGRQRDDLRDQLDVLSRRMRRVQDMADRGGLVMAKDLARVLGTSRIAAVTDAEQEPEPAA